MEVLTMLQFKKCIEGIASGVSKKSTGRATALGTDL